MLVNPQIRLVHFDPWLLHLMAMRTGFMGHFTICYLYAYPSFLPQAYVVCGATFSSIVIPIPFQWCRSHLSLPLMWRCWKPPIKGALRFVACDSQTFWVKILHVLVGAFKKKSSSKWDDAPINCHILGSLCFAEQNHFCSESVLKIDPYDMKIPKCAS